MRRLAERQRDQEKSQQSMLAGGPSKHDLVAKTSKEADGPSEKNEEEYSSSAEDDTVCAVCNDGTTSDGNEIILCDGPCDTV